MSERLPELVAMSRFLGDPAHDLAILAEGNTSCNEEGSFWVKASGFSLNGIGPEGFVRCRPEPLLESFGTSPTDAAVSELLLSCRSGDGQKPSVEAFMHAWLLTLPGVEFVGHVHPTAILALLCSAGAEGLCSMRFFPDDVVCCGVATAWVPYVDPGLFLAEAIKESVTNFGRVHGEPPKVIWMQNHGMIALGRTANEVKSAIMMNVKVARVVQMAGGLGAVEKGSLTPLSAETVERIHSRPDEHYRQELLWKLGAGD